jgi:hypothetical protein
MDSVLPFWSNKTLGRAARHASMEVGARCEHGRHVQSTCRWFGHFIEYVSRIAVPDLETVFGPAQVRIWIWANYESCSFHDALQILFKDPDHWSNVLWSN